MIRSGWTIVALLLALSPAPSFAAVLPLNVQVQFLIAHLPAVTFTGLGTGISVGGGIATIPAELFAGNAAISIPISPTFIGLDRMTVPASSLDNPAGSFGPDGAMGLAGAVYFEAGGVPYGVVPLFRIGGTDAFGSNFSVGALAGSIQGATWMGGTRVFKWTSAALAIPFTATATAYDNRTPGGVGVIQLVAPAKLVLGVFGNLPAFGILTLNYTPEPGTLTLLGAGITALAMIGRRKLEKTR